MKEALSGIYTEIILTLGVLLIAFLYHRYHLRKKAQHPKPSSENPPKVALYPFYRASHFVGRFEQLNTLMKRFDSSDRTTPIQVLCGPPGVGKTTLAIEYTNRVFNQYQFVSWICADSMLTFKGDFAWIARELNLVDQQSFDLGEALSAVRTWLSEHDNWLLVFDDLPGPLIFEDEAEKDGSFISLSIADLLPSRPKGHVIVTSTNPDFGNVADTIFLENFSDEEAASFLKKRLRPSLHSKAGELAAKLGNYPLALNLATGAIEAQSMSIDDFIEMDGIENQSDEAKIERIVPEVLQHAKPEIEPFVAFCSALAPNYIPQGWLQSAAKNDVLPPEINSTVKRIEIFTATLETVHNLGLMLTGPTDMLVQPSVRAAIRKRMENEKLEKMAETLLDLVVRFMPGSYEPENVWAWENLMPHAHEAACLAEGYKINSQDMATLLFQIGGYYFGRSELEKALRFYERSLPIQSRLTEKDWESEGTILRQIGYTLEHLGDPLGALEQFLQALQIFEKGLGHMHAAISATAIQAGRMYALTGQWEEAKLQYLRALAVDEKVHGQESVETAETLNFLGTCLQQMEDFQGAIIRYEKALAILKKRYGEKHAEVTACMSYLSHALVELGDTQQAEKVSTQALHIDEKLQGTVHLDIARDHNDLSYVLQVKGDLKGARKQIERALWIQEKLQGREHVNVATLVGNQARLLNLMGDTEGSKQGFERALSIREKWYGRQSPALTSVLVDLGELNYKRMDYDGSLACYKRVLDIQQAHMDEDHPVILDIRRRIESVERMKGQVGQA